MWHGPKVFEFVCLFHSVLSKKVLEWSCSKSLETLGQTYQRFLIQLITKSAQYIRSYKAYNSAELPDQGKDKLSKADKLVVVHL